jgi:hypothetical protein
LTWKKWEFFKNVWEKKRIWKSNEWVLMFQRVYPNHAWTHVYLIPCFVFMCWSMCLFE